MITLALRKARIDASGAFHHIIVREIERRKIFWDDADRDSFFDRHSRVASDTGAGCFAWALIPTTRTFFAWRRYADSRKLSEHR